MSFLLPTLQNAHRNICNHIDQQHSHSHRCWRNISLQGCRKTSQMNMQLSFLILPSASVKAGFTHTFKEFMLVWKIKANLTDFRPNKSIAGTSRGLRGKYPSRLMFSRTTTSQQMKMSATCGIISARGSLLYRNTRDLVQNKNWQKIH